MNDVGRNWVASESNRILQDLCFDSVEELRPDRRFFQWNFSCRELGPPVRSAVFVTGHILGKAGSQPVG